MPFTTEFTQAQVDALSKQIALGVKEVWHNGRKTEFQTAQEMIDLRDRMKKEIAAASTAPQPIPCMTRRTIFAR